MDPHTIRIWQVYPPVAASLVLSLLFGREGALCVAMAAATTALIWTMLADRYRRRRNSWVSPQRLEGDRVMAANGGIALAPSLVLACAVGAVGIDPLVEPVWVAIPLSIPLLAILLSSSVDWYVVLPFRDGIVGLPACRIDAVPVTDRRRYTKLWVAHRLICELSIAVSLGIAGILVVHHYAHNLGPIITVVGVLGIPSVAASRIIWDRWIMGGLRFCLRQGPALGNWVAGPTYTRREGERMREGFVLDASLDNGLKIVAEPGATEYFVSLRDAVPDISVHKKDYACAPDRCEAWLRNEGGNGERSVTCDIYHQRASGSTAGV